MAAFDETFGPILTEHLRREPQVIEELILPDLHAFTIKRAQLRALREDESRILEAGDTPDVSMVDAIGDLQDEAGDIAWDITATLSEFLEDLVHVYKPKAL